MCYKEQMGTEEFAMPVISPRLFCKELTVPRWRGGLGFPGRAAAETFTPGW